MKPENKVIMVGRVTLKPIFSPGITKNGSIDFELSNREGRHQIVSDNPDIVRNLDLIKGTIRVIGSLSARTDDSFIIADRIELT